MFKIFFDKVTDPMHEVVQRLPETLTWTDFIRYFRLNKCILVHVWVVSLPGATLLPQQVINAAVLPTAGALPPLAVSP